MLETLQTVTRNFLELVFPTRDKEKMVSSLTEAEILQLPRVSIHVDHIYSLFSYKDKRVQALIWELKYHRNLKALEIAGRMLAELVTEELSDMSLFENVQTALLVPIPITAKRLRERTFCQTDLICKEMMKYFDSDVMYSPEALKKIRETEKQSWTKSRAERLRNLAGAFSADPKVVTGQNIILIDDVTTTGATIAEATRTLMSAGAKSVTSFTIAH